MLTVRAVLHGRSRFGAAVTSIGHRRNGALGDQQDRLSPASERWRLSLATVLAATFVAGAVVLALPLEPRNFWDGLEAALESPAVLAILIAVTAVALLACVRRWRY